MPQLPEEQRVKVHRQLLLTELAIYYLEQHLEEAVEHFSVEDDQVLQKGMIVFKGQSIREPTNAELQAMIASVQRQVAKYTRQPLAPVEDLVLTKLEVDTNRNGGVPTGLKVRNTVEAGKAYQCFWWDSLEEITQLALLHQIDCDCYYRHDEVGDVVAMWVPHGTPKGRLPADDLSFSSNAYDWERLSYNLDPTRLVIGEPQNEKGGTQC